MLWKVGSRESRVGGVVVVWYWRGRRRGEQNVVLYDIWGWGDKEAGYEEVGIESERYDVDVDGHLVSFNFDSSYCNSDY